jgi:uncharacterized protein YjbI with pentapeptide repeats
LSQLAGSTEALNNLNLFDAALQCTNFGGANLAGSDIRGTSLADTE